MCYYITGTIAPGDKAVEVRRIAEEYHIHWDPIENLSIKKQLRTGETYYCTTWGMCDCGTTLGSGRIDASRPRSHDRKLSQLRKQGWSEAKIQRWIADRETVANRKENAKAKQAAIPGHDAERWTDFCGAVLTRNAAKTIGLLLHWYKRSIESERLSNLKCQTLTLDQLTPEFLAKIDEDVLYRFYVAERRG